MKDKGVKSVKLVSKPISKLKKKRYTGEKSPHQKRITRIGGQSSGKVFQGTYKGGEKGTTPNSIYEQLDSKGNLMKRSFYDDQGRMISRQDFVGKHHFDKVTGQYIDKHQHNYRYDSYGNRKEISATKISE